jgi:hypothetical protein
MKYEFTLAAEIISRILKEQGIFNQPHVCMSDILTDGSEYDLCSIVNYIGGNNNSSKINQFLDDIAINLYIAFMTDFLTTFLTEKGITKEYCQFVRNAYHLRQSCNDDECISHIVCHEQQTMLMRKFDVYINKPFGKYETEFVNGWKTYAKNVGFDWQTGIVIC